MSKRKPHWNELVPTFSINPEAADRDDVAQLATDLMQARHTLWRIANGDYPKAHAADVCAECLRKLEE